MISKSSQISDLVALPDFAAGAMENWGLITYRERALLYDEKFYTPHDKIRVALVIAHELSHQVLFRDLIPCSLSSNQKPDLVFRHSI